MRNTKNKSMVNEIGLDMQMRRKKLREFMNNSAAISGSRGSSGHGTDTKLDRKSNHKRSLDNLTQA